jgi:hypothetical protein
MERIPCPGSGCEKMIERPQPGQTVHCDCGQVVHGGEARTRIQSGLMTRKEVARILQVSEHYVGQHRKRTTWYGSRYYYSLQDLYALRTKINLAENPSVVLKEQREDSGYFTITAAAKKFNVPEITWSVGIKKGRINRPTHMRGFYTCYTTEEAQEIANILLAHRIPEGKYSRADVIAHFGLGGEKLQTLLRNHPEIGTVLTRTRRYYDDTDLAKITAILVKRYAAKTEVKML